MGARVLPLRRAQRPQRILTHAEVRQELDLPPANPVDWHCSANGKSCVSKAQLWMEARRLGAIELGVLPDLVVCVRVEELKLDGSGKA